MEVSAAFQGYPILMGGDFNVTLEAMDRPKNTGGQDPNLKDFLVFISEVTLQEVQPVDCLYTWRITTGQTVIPT